MLMFNNTMAKNIRTRRWLQTMDYKILHRKLKTGYHDHHFKPGMNWKGTCSCSNGPLISSTFSLLRNQPRKQEGLRCQKGSGLFLYVDVYFSYNFDECFLLSRKPYELDQISLNTTVGDYIRNPLKQFWLFGKFWFWSNFKPLSSFLT
jgi:hypothetical protein